MKKPLSSNGCLAAPDCYRDSKRGRLQILELNTKGVEKKSGTPASAERLNLFKDDDVKLSIPSMHTRAMLVDDWVLIMPMMLKNYLMNKMLKDKSAITGIMMILIFYLCGNCHGQQRFFSKRDLLPLSLTFAAGHMAGHREEILYHPKQLFNRYPNLNRNFWDIRTLNEPGFLNTEWDGDHVFELGSKSMMIAAVVFKVGEKKKWYWYLWDGFMYGLTFKAGEFSSYNLIHKNKL